MGVWQSENYIIVFPALPFHLPPKEASLDIPPPPAPPPIQVPPNTQGQQKFLSYADVERLGNMFLSGMSDTAEGQGQMRPRAGARVLQTLSGCVVTARHTALVDGGRPAGSRLARLLWSVE